MTRSRTRNDARNRNFSHLTIDVGKSPRTGRSRAFRKFPLSAPDSLVRTGRFADVVFSILAHYARAVGQHARATESTFRYNRLQKRTIGPVMGRTAIDTFNLCGNVPARVILAIATIARDSIPDQITIRRHASYSRGVSADPWPIRRIAGRPTGQDHDETSPAAIPNQ